MQSVSNTVQNLVDALEPVRLRLDLVGDGEETAVDAGILRCTLRASCGGTDQLSIGSACSGSVSLTLDAAASLGLKGQYMRLKWSVKEAWYPLFTGVCTRERVENGQLSLELHDLIYVYGGKAYEGAQGGSDALSALNSVRAQMGGPGLEGDTELEAEGLVLSLDNLPSGATLADTLALIAGCMGGNALITREGRLAVRRYRSVDMSTPCYDGSDAREASAYAVTGLTFIRRDTDADGIETETEYAAGDGSLKLENSIATQALTDYAYAKIEGLSVYAGSYTIPGGLLLEPGDIIGIESGETSYPVACADLTMEIDGGVKTTVTSCGAAETGGVSGSLNQRVDSALKGVSEVLGKVAQERTAREQAVESLNQTLADSAGLYATPVAQSDGSTIYYLHDKATLDKSTLVIKFTADAIGVSNNGGQSYNYGFTANGDAILRLIYAVGLNADYINAGVIRSQVGDSFYLDLSTGELRLKLNGESPVTGTVMTATETEYYLSESRTELTGGSWSAQAPGWVEGKYLWSRTRTAMSDGSEVWTEPVCLSGADGANGEDAVTLRIDSSRGTVFKNSAVSTVLSAVIYQGANRITDYGALIAAFGPGAHLEWSWQRLGEESFGIILADDSRLSNDGFTLTVTPDDVDTKVVFACQLII